MDCATFDGLPVDAAVALLQTCCSSPAWAQRVAADRPYGHRDALLRAATEATLALSDSELREALAGHPRIGERSDSAASQREQSSVTTASDEVRAALAAGNRAYEEKFGHVYLVRAAGRSAGELLEILNIRLGHDAASERGEVRAALADINRLRLDLLIDEETDPDVAGGTE